MKWSRRTHRPGRSAALVLLALAAAAAGCEDMLVAGPLPEAGNVEFMLGANVVQTDTAVLVNGHPLMRYPSGEEALVLSRLERYDLGGFPELGYSQDARHALSWMLQFTHAFPREQVGDSVIYRYHDHGTVTVGGVAMDRNTDPPFIGPGGPPIRLENWVRYILMASVRVDWMHGGAPLQVDAPFHPDLTAGRPIPIRTEGSATVGPVEASIAARPMTRLTGLENRGTMELHGAVPVAHASDPLILTFDRPLDPQRAFLLIHPMQPLQQSGARAAFVRPAVPSNRVVLPSHILQQLVEGAGQQSAYRIIVVEFLVEDDAISGAYADGSGGFSLPFVQRGETTVHLYLRR
jgi:hypothetical protein